MILTDLSKAIKNLYEKISFHKHFNNNAAAQIGEHLLFDFEFKFNFLSSVICNTPRPQSLLLISKAHKLRLKLLISEYRNDLYN